MFSKLSISRTVLPVNAGLGMDVVEVPHVCAWRKEGYSFEPGDYFED